MPRNLCLIRPCLGLTTRIEFVIKPMAGENGLWTLLCAAGLAGSQPTAIKAQGPFHGPRVAEDVLDAIVACLAGQGYISVDDPPIWQLHLLAEFRKLNGNRARAPGHYLSLPES
ncbi:MAG: hypothetical protein GAK43_01571 [Stenotrophomonas maltophilia]|nr:MAG: hypothetical protein GAK43_01571 [Stenotrophomonas maltophilia]